MPKIFIHYPVGTFNPSSLADLADEMTTIGLECEKLANTESVRNTVWVYATEHVFGTHFAGGRAVSTRNVSVEVNALEGGLDDAGKLSLMERMTASIQRHAKAGANDPVHVYLLIREVPESNWGMDGKTVSLKELR